MTSTSNPPLPNSSRAREPEAVLPHELARSVIKADRSQAVIFGAARLLELSDELKCEVKAFIGYHQSPNSSNIFQSSIYLPPEKLILRFHGASEADFDLVAHIVRRCDTIRKDALAHLNSEQQKVFFEQALAGSLDKPGAVGTVLSTAQKQIRVLHQLLESRISTSTQLFIYNENSPLNAAQILCQSWGQLVSPNAVTSFSSFDDTAKREAESRGEYLATIHSHPATFPLLPSLTERVVDLGCQFSPERLHAFLQAEDLDSWVSSAVQEWESEIAQLQELKSEYLTIDRNDPDLAFNTLIALPAEVGLANTQDTKRQRLVLDVMLRSGLHPSDFAVSAIQDDIGTLKSYIKYLEEWLCLSKSGNPAFLIAQLCQDPTDPHAGTLCASQTDLLLRETNLLRGYLELVIETPVGRVEVVHQIGALSSVQNVIVGAYRTTTPLSSAAMASDTAYEPVPSPLEFVSSQGARSGLVRDRSTGEIAYLFIGESWSVESWWRLHKFQYLERAGFVSESILRSQGLDAHLFSFVQKEPVPLLATGEHGEAAQEAFHDLNTLRSYI